MTLIGMHAAAHEDAFRVRLDGPWGPRVRVFTSARPTFAPLAVVTLPGVDARRGAQAESRPV